MIFYKSLLYDRIVEYLDVGTHSLLFQFSFLYITIHVIFIFECIFYIVYKFFFSFAKVLYNNNFILKLISINQFQNNLAFITDFIKLFLHSICSVICAFKLLLTVVQLLQSSSIHSAFAWQNSVTTKIVWYLNDKLFHLLNICPYIEIYSNLWKPHSKHLFVDILNRFMSKSKININNRRLILLVTYYICTCLLT